ncbi:hypothetical protein HU200_012158 [Digitaria exilis]|uniref:Late embryogenesis abundant protein LEA-2 subgroup domain-containing protein n=1 Tax=Digitaria exilis TaxID=1010633 RepID=A0A835FFD9_9POAL|nr:hypothetical protein HU200_012158 [Digitaria exilis]
MVDKDDVGQCLCCVLKTFFGGIGCCCLGALEFACSICGLFIGVVLICVLVPAYGVVYPVRATVRDASVSHLALAGANGTALAYDLSLTVALRNRNWAMRAEPSAPLVAELLFAGRRLEGATLADDVSGASSIDPHREEELRMRAVSSSKGLEVGGDGAAEFARESVDGMVELELRLTGAFKYRPVHVGGSRRMDVRCPLKLPVAPPPAAATPGLHWMSTVFDNVRITCH